MGLSKNLPARLECQLFHFSLSFRQTLGAPVGIVPLVNDHKSTAKTSGKRTKNGRGCPPYLVGGLPLICNYFIFTYKNLECHGYLIQVEVGGPLSGVRPTKQMF